MKRYEYKIESGSCMDSDDLMEFLNELGIDRWELVSWNLTYTKESYHSYHYSAAIFKRIIKD